MEVDASLERGFAVMFVGGIIYFVGAVFLKIASKLAISARSPPPNPLDIN